MSAYAFDRALLPQTIALPEGFEVRPLSRNDNMHGHIELLGHLTKAPSLSSEVYHAQFDQMLACPHTYFPVALVHLSSGQLVGTATLIVEFKFIRGAGKVGHVEDVVVDPSHGGKSFGKLLIQVLSELAKAQGCYKVILDCDAKNIGFYEKCNYHNAGIEMALYHNK